ARGASGYHDRLYRSETTTIFFAFLVLPGVALLTGVAYRLAGSVTREREQRTLESLLTLPISRWSLLRAKWLGSLLSFNLCLIAFALTLLIGVLAGALHPLSGLLLALAFGVQV